MVWIKFANEDLVRLHDDDLMPDDYWIDVNQNGSARVTEDVAAQLVESDLAVTYKED